MIGLQENERATTPQGQGQKLKETLKASAQSMGKGMQAGVHTMQAGVHTMGKSVQNMSKGFTSMLGKMNMQEKMQNMLTRKKGDKRDPRSGHVYRACDTSAPFETNNASENTQNDDDSDQAAEL